MGLFSVNPKKRMQMHTKLATKPLSSSAGLNPPPISVLGTIGGGPSGSASELPPQAPSKLEMLLRRRRL